MVSDPKDMNPFTETNPDAPRELPPLTVMSLSICSIVNHQENKREVICTTSRIWHNSKSNMIIWQLRRPVHAGRGKCATRGLNRCVNHT